MSETHSPSRSRGAVLRIVALDVAPPLVGYYGLRACGASEYTALLAATVLSEQEPGAAAYRRTAHILLSAMWGIGLLVEVAVRLVIISRVSVDVANGVLSAESWGTVGLLIAATFLVGRKLAARWEQRGAPQG